MSNFVELYNTARKLKEKDHWGIAETAACRQLFIDYMEQYPTSTLFDKEQVEGGYILTIWRDVNGSTLKLYSTPQMSGYLLTDSEDIPVVLPSSNVINRMAFRSLQSLCDYLELKPTATTKSQEAKAKAGACELVGYAEEMLKIRNMLYPDSDRVRKNIIAQIGMVVDLLVDKAPTGELVGKEARYTHYNAGHGITVVSAMHGSQFISITMDENAGVAYSNLLLNGEEATQSELMYAFQSISNVYKTFC